MRMRSWGGINRLSSPSTAVARLREVRGQPGISIPPEARRSSSPRARRRRRADQTATLSTSCGRPSKSSGWRFGTGVPGGTRGSCHEDMRGRSATRPLANSAGQIRPDAQAASPSPGGNSKAASGHCNRRDPRAQACVICSPPVNLARTRCSATSSCGRTGSGSWSYAPTSGSSTPLICRSRWSVTSSARSRPRPSTAGWSRERRRTRSRSRADRSTHRGHTLSMHGQPWPILAVQRQEVLWGLRAAKTATASTSPRRTWKSSRSRASTWGPTAHAVAAT